jgi:hypothetical protein
MVQKTKIALIAALTGLSLASPARSQAFSSSYGTGNPTPSYFGEDGGLRHGYQCIRLGRDIAMLVDEVHGRKVS